MLRARLDSTKAYVNKVNARSACSDGTERRGDESNTFVDKVDLQLNAERLVRRDVPGMRASARTRFCRQHDFLRVKASFDAIQMWKIVVNYLSSSI